MCPNGHLKPSGQRRISMNIQEAKNEIKNTIRLYLEKDENGEYRVPVVRQRPVFLIGAPGIGKTAIMEQIAAEMDIAIVSYSMTHHTRQSAIGLPYLADKDYAGHRCTVSEYTTSEIIASIYEIMERSGKREGILFLDEINCVSETLAPSMLLFLQYKRFGNEHVPQGWVVVTAGNPPQFNKSVKEFDIVTLDRLKYMAVEENYQVWKQYASSAGIHPAVLAYLDMNPDHFYMIKTTVTGKQYITARGWEDLSTTLRGYERNQIAVSSTLIMEYITVPDVARKFSVYYDLFKKYRTDYDIPNILLGKHSQALIKKAAGSTFDEHLSIIAMLKDALCETFCIDMHEEDMLQKSVKILRSIKRSTTDQTIAECLHNSILSLQEELSRKTAAGCLERDEKFILKGSILLLSEYLELANDTEKQKFKALQEAFAKRVEKHNNSIKHSSTELKNVFGFIRKCWKEGQEMVLFVSELTMNRYSSSFIAKWGSDDYYQYNHELLVYDQDQKLKNEISDLLKAL